MKEYLKIYRETNKDERKEYDLINNKGLRNSVKNTMN